MSENPVGRSWYRDGFLFEPLKGGRVRISVATKDVPRDLIIDRQSFIALARAVCRPEAVWSNRGHYAQAEAPLMDADKLDEIAMRLIDENRDWLKEMAKK